MKGMRLLLALAVALVAGCKAETASSVDSIVLPFLGPGLGGVAVAVVRNGTVVAKKGFGPADIENRVPVTSETVFELASLSKQFTGLAVLLLAQRGELSMDDDARKYVPEVPVFDPARPIRLDDLSRHMSGLPEFPRGQDIPTQSDRLAWLAKQTALEFPTGTQWAYRNLNYFLLARVVERVSGKTLRAFLEEQVFRPAGMTNAQVLDFPTGAIRHRATGYCFGKPCRLDDGLTGAGGVFASLDDMIAWDRALADGTIVKSDALLEALKRGYAFGWGVATRDGHRMMWHDGDSIGASTYVARYLDTPLTIVVLSNQTRLEVDKLERKLAERFLKASTR
jgi:CubicO group peptidase (beta-lactamase class C family)